jgi:hypothetical protein
MFGVFCLVGLPCSKPPLNYQHSTINSFRLPLVSVRFKSLEDLALDVVGRTVARVSAEEHMANYQAARALMGKGNSERDRERGSSAKKSARKSAVKKAKPKK